MSNKLCVSTVINKAYQKYIPIFLYFCLKSYPNYNIKLFLTEGLNNNYKFFIDELSKFGYIDIKEYCFKEYPKSNQELKMLRWMLDSNDFDGYEYAYIGDIDIIICREDKPLLDQHLDHCAETKLPYSNSVRPNSRRLSGLHFIKKDDYYFKMDHIIQKYKNELRNNQLNRVKNEELLYKMVVESGFCLPEGWFRPHHGIHLGLYRKGERILGNSFWAGGASREDYKSYYKFYKSIVSIKDPLFNKIINSTVKREVKAMEKSFSIEFDKELDKNGV